MKAFDKLSNMKSFADVAADADEIGAVPSRQDVRSKLVSSEVLTLVQSKFDDMNVSMQEAFEARKPEQGHIEEDGYSSESEEYPSSSMS